MTDPLWPRAPRLADERQALEAARRLADAARPGAAERDWSRAAPQAERRLWAQSGLAGLSVPTAQGGADLPLSVLAEVFVLLGAADPALATLLRGHYALVAELRAAGAHPAATRQLALAADGVLLAGAEESAELTLPPPVHRLVGRLRAEPGALLADRLRVPARDGQGRPLHAWIAHGAAGLRVDDAAALFGLRAAPAGQLVLDQVAVAETDLYPAPELASAARVARLLDAAIDVGLALAATEDAAGFVRERARPWMDAGVARAADDPLLVHDFGQLRIALHAAQALLHEAAQAETEVADAAVDAAAAQAARTALQAGEKLLELAGSSATRAAHRFDRHWRNARVHQLRAAPAHALERLGRRLLGPAPAISFGAGR